jgi:CDGSH iron-sulfur domain-containing protein 3
MDMPKVAGTAPCKISIEQGKKYAWCTCGLSAQQPLCDGSHKGSDFKPNVFVAQASEERWMCACKKTGDSPWCDGSHKTLGHPAEGTADCG